MRKRGNFRAFTNFMVMMIMEIKFQHQKVQILLPNVGPFFGRFGYGEIIASMHLGSNPRCEDY
ncbi:hypothetical protein BVRB_1g002920 [Beta vulgaris subsp. vulgaris]|nr:hypothetical protein BVRB_1g002920 [Beta vulgaris subsp. vulgaris]